jgi:hypothetical protein
MGFFNWAFFFFFFLQCLTEKNKRMFGFAPYNANIVDLDSLSSASSVSSWEEIEDEERVDRDAAFAAYLSSCVYTSLDSTHPSTSTSRSSEGEEEDDDDSAYESCAFGGFVAQIPKNPLVQPGGIFFHFYKLSNLCADFFGALLLVRAFPLYRDAKDLIFEKLFLLHFLDAISFQPRQGYLDH